MQHLKKLGDLIWAKKDMERNAPEKFVFQNFSNGDTEAFGIIYSYFKDVVTANILKIIHQPEIAEDILQDTFIKLWENHHKFTDKQSVAAWLFKVSYHTSIDHIRALLRARQKAEAALLLIEDSEKLHQQEESFQEFYYKEALLQEAINMLPPRKREVFELCKLQGKSYSEVSEAMNIAKSTVKDYITESNKFIRQHVMSRYSQSSYNLLLFITFSVF